MLSLQQQPLHFLPLSLRLSSIWHLLPVTLKWLLLSPLLSVILTFLVNSIVTETLNEETVPLEWFLTMVSLQFIHKIILTNFTFVEKLFKRPLYFL
jgi:hypothetical protein